MSEPSTHAPINTHEQLKLAGGGIAISSARALGRTPYHCGWYLYRVGADGREISTASRDDSAWYEYRRRHFYDGMRRDRFAEALKQAQAWAAAHFDEPGPWVRNRQGDYIPTRINKQFPLGKR